MLLPRCATNLRPRALLQAFLRSLEGRLKDDSILTTVRISFC